jgi:hypothetical protein
MDKQVLEKVELIKQSYENYKNRDTDTIHKLR